MRAGRRPVRSAWAGCLLVVAAALPTSAQELEPRATHIETELGRPGRLLVETRRAYPVVRLRGGPGLVVVAVRAVEPGREQERILGVRVELRGATASVAHLDVYEIEAVVRAIDFMSTQVDKGAVAGDDPTELRLRTLDGLAVGVVVTDGRPRRFVQVGDSPRLAASHEAFVQLRHRLDEARRWLFGE